MLTGGQNIFTGKDLIYLYVFPFVTGQEIPFKQAFGFSNGNGISLSNIIPCTTVVKSSTTSSSTRYYSKIDTESFK